MLIGIVDFEKKKRQNSAEHYWFEHLKHFVNFFSYKSLNGANDCCCCMLICTKIDFVGLPKYWLKDPSICIFICLYCTNLKFEYWVISIQRLGVIVVELVSKRDCKRSDFANCNQKKKNHHHTMRRATEEHTWTSRGEEGSIHLLVKLQYCVNGRAHPYKPKIWRCEVQWGYLGYILIAPL